MPAFSDSKHTIDPNNAAPQVKYWAFPDNFSSEAAVLGNQDAIEQAKTILRDAVNPIQRMIADAFKELYGMVS